MSPDSKGPFDLIFGLPLHIFVNHAVVVLLPLGAIALVLTILIPALRKHYVIPSIAIVSLGAAAAVIAEQSGEFLEERVGSAGQHAEWGELVVPVALALVAVGVVWALIYRSRNALMKVLSILGAIGIIALSAASVTLVVLAGHSGADLTWSERVAPGVETVTASPEEEDAGQDEPPAEAESGTVSTVLSEDLVASYASAEACWTIVNGQVYDLTTWIDEHPGGSSRILGMCGRDATADFAGQHGGQQRPEDILQGYLLGSLGDTLP